MLRSFDSRWATPLDQLDESQRALIAAWAIAQVDADIRYWNPMWAKGRTCLEFVEGRIFSQDELADFTGKEIVPIQTPELKPAMDAIMGQLLSTGKSGKVIAAGPEDAGGAHVRTIILKAISRDNQLEYREAQVARDTFTTSVPGWLWIEAFDPNATEEPGITWVQEDWDSVVPDPGWHDRQLRDLQRATRVRRWTLEDIESYVQDDTVKERLKTDWERLGQCLPQDYDGRASLIERARSSRAEFDITNKLVVYEMTHWVNVSVQTWHNLQIGTSGVVPQNWTPEEIQSFSEMNPSVKIVTERRRVLWVTSVTGSGVLIANGPHWLQSGKFPGVPCVPDRINGKWAGLVEFVLDTVKAGAYAETIWAHSIRTLTNNFWLAKKGAIVDMDEFQRQQTSINGIGFIEDGFEIADVHKVENNREQRAFMEWKETTRAQLSRLLVSDNFVGGVQSSQEANSAIETRIDQNLSRLAPLIYGWHAFRLQLRRISVSAMPYAITSEKVFRHLDPSNGMQQVAVNVPSEWDAWGEVVSTMNNLEGDEFDYIESEVDDSRTGQQASTQELKEFFESLGNMPPENHEAAALASPSHAVQEYGRMVKKMREEAPPPAPEVKNSVSLDANTLGANPLAQLVAKNLGVLTDEDIASLKQPSGLPIEQEQPMIPNGIGLGDPAMTEGMPNG